MTGTRILVTGVEHRLGHLIAEQSASRADVEVVLGVAVDARPAVVGVHVVGLPEEYAGIAELLSDHGIDTIVHADRPWVEAGRGPNGARRHVIATMRLMAAAARRSAAVRSVVMASSTRVYPASSRAARLHPESEPLFPRRGSLAAALLEAESYVRDLATTNPNLSASILRLSDLAGRGPTTRCRRCSPARSSRRCGGSIHRFSCSTSTTPRPRSSTLLTVTSPVSTTSVPATSSVGGAPSAWPVGRTSSCPPSRPGRSPVSSGGPTE